MTIRAGHLRENTDGVSAVEFALVAPLFLALVFGVICFSTLMSTYNGVQQLVAEAARAAVAGLSDIERDRIARDFVTGNATNYPFIDPTKVQVSTTSNAAKATFQVAVRYDMSDSFVYRFGDLLPLPQPVFQRSSIIQRGGY